ncbi:hypothetical protein P261_01140 [Lachnospiraceae bacterium TWA4]|nr:hypothetical protein P261_01140 [Lachnospiraceae bacterium TWA4]
MQNLTEKQLKKILKGIGITAAVYLIFKYLLSLVVPFLFAFLLSVLLKPAVAFIHNKIPFLKEKL